MPFVKTGLVFQTNQSYLAISGIEGYYREKLCFNNTPLWILDSNRVHDKWDQILISYSFLQSLTTILQTNAFHFFHPFDLESLDH